MGDYLRTSSKKIERDAENIKELTDAIPKLMKEMEAAMHRLENCWEGPAWIEYQNTNTYYVEVLTEIYQYYMEYTTALLQASQDYHRTEQDVMDQIDSWFL